MLNKSQIMKEAHKRVRENRKLYPVSYGSVSYAEAFAATLKYVWQDARLGKLEAPVSRRDEIKGEITRIELKTRMCAADFARVDRLRAEWRVAA